MNDDVRHALADLCKDKRPDEYVFVSDKPGSCVREVKKDFHSACKLAGIEGLIWKDLGPRLALDWRKPAATRSRSRSCLDTQIFE